MAAVQAWLEQHHRWLLIFDNVHEPWSLVGLMPRRAAGHVLVTSQVETGWEQLADPLRVEILSTTDAARFLMARTQQGGPQAKAAAESLATALGDSVGAGAAGAFVSAAGTIDLAEYAAVRRPGVGAAATLAAVGLPAHRGDHLSLALRRLQKTKPSRSGCLPWLPFCC